MIYQVGTQITTKVMGRLLLGLLLYVNELIRYYRCNGDEDHIKIRKFVKIYNHKLDIMMIFAITISCNGF